MTDTTPDYAGLKLRRKLSRYHGAAPTAIADGSRAQMIFFIEDAKHDIAALDAFLRTLLERNAELERERDEEREIVARIWRQLGSPSYDELKGRSIYDLIDEIKARAKELEAALRLAAGYLGSPASGSFSGFRDDDRVQLEIDVRIGDIKAIRSASNG